jgi:hypothetical protein
MLDAVCIAVLAKLMYWTLFILESERERERERE